MFKKLRSILTLIAIILSIMGIVTFSLFILEESFQTVMFGTWPAQDAKRWDIVHTGTRHMRRIIFTMKLINYSVGWVQPLAFISYGSYAKSAEYYVESLEAKCFAFEPELFVGKDVSFRFKPKHVEQLNGGAVLLSNGKIGAITQAAFDRRSQTISGRLIEYEGKLVVDLR